MFNPDKEFDPKAQLVAKAVLDKFISKGRFDNLNLIDTKEDNNALRDAILGLGARLPGSFNVDNVILELKKMGVITPPQKEKVIEIPKHIETEYLKIDGLNKIEVNEEKLKTIEANLLYSESVGNGKIFKSDQDLEDIHNKALSLQKERVSESPEYYYEFADQGLIKGGREEVEKDLKALDERKSEFKVIDELNTGDNQKLNQSKKIATITEQALSYSVTKLGWYSDKITIEPAPEFTDVKRGVDDVLEIRKDEDESDFIGLGIDVTYRGLKSEQFKDKLFKLLGSIKDGHKTKVKYHTNHAGKKMKEFVVPKIILYFDVDNVKDLVKMISSIDNPDAMEEFKKHPMKFSVMNQIINSCNKLSSFAEDCKNDVFRKYVGVRNSIRELSWENPELEYVFEENHEDEMSKHLDVLIKEFKDKNS